MQVQDLGLFAQIASAVLMSMRLWEQTQNYAQIVDIRWLPILQQKYLQELAAKNVILPSASSTVISARTVEKLLANHWI